MVQLTLEQDIENLRCKLEELESSTGEQFMDFHNKLQSELDSVRCDMDMEVLNDDTPQELAKLRVETFELKQETRDLYSRINELNSDLETEKNRNNNIIKSVSKLAEYLSNLNSISTDNQVDFSNIASELKQL